MALSDHNILAEGDYWKSIPENPSDQMAFDKYLEKYGNEWVNYREDSGRLEVKLKTFREYEPLFGEQDKFLIFPSEEISDRYENKPIHLVASNVQEFIPTQKGESVSQVLQNNINALLSQKGKTGIPMLIHVAHPNFRYALTAEDISSLTGERFFEVYNGHPVVNNLGDSLHIGVEEMWDLVNMAYIKKRQPLIYGLATDDTHHYHQAGPRWANAGRGWIMVKAATLNEASLFESMEQGQFYASTGVRLKDVVYHNNTLKVIVEPEVGIDYQILFIGCHQGDNFTSVLEEMEGTVAEFELQKDVTFVRAKVISSKLKENPNYETEFEVAWIQPVSYLDE